MAVAEVPKYGGYDSDFVGEVHEKFICSICTKVLRDPHLTGCCGQHFCESCLTHWFTNHQAETCPHCREENFTHMQDKHFKREITQLKVHCTLRKDGCTWQGELGDLQTHLDSDTGCGFVKLDCPNKCKEYADYGDNYNIVATTLKRKDIAQHLSSECYLRRYKCKYCNIEDTYEAITGLGAPDHDLEGFDDFDPHPSYSHYSECPMIPLDCPNECGAKKIKRKDMSSHRDQCPQEKIQCPNQCSEGKFLGDVYGYTTGVFSRKDLQDHLRTCYLRKYKCEHCGHEDTYQAITGEGGPMRSFHHLTCLNFPLVCPNKCAAVKIKRKDMPTHQEQCPMEPVQCPFQEAGCQTRLVRRDLDNHMTTQTQRHLLLTFQTMKQQVDGLKKENADLRKQCNGLSERCDYLSKENSVLKQELRMLKGRQK